MGSKLVSIVPPCPQPPVPAACSCLDFLLWWAAAISQINLFSTWFLSLFFTAAEKQVKLSVWHTMLPSLNKTKQNKTKQKHTSIWVSDLPACVYLYHACEVPGVTRRGHHIPWNRSYRWFKPSCGCSEPNLGLLEKQVVLSIPTASFLPPWHISLRGFSIAPVPWFVCTW